MGRLIITLAALLLTACGGVTGNNDHVEIPTTGPKRASSIEHAKRRAEAWCQQQKTGHAVWDEDGDANYYKFDCR